MPRKYEQRNRLVEENLGIIVKVVVRYWRHMPGCARASADPADLIQDAVLHALTALESFDPQKACITTYLWRVTENYCREKVAAAYAQKRFAEELVPVDGLRWLQARPDTVGLVPAVDALERVLEKASRATVRSFERFRLSRCKPNWKAGERDEFFRLAHRMGLGPRDLERVMLELV